MKIVKKKLRNTKDKIKLSKTIKEIKQEFDKIELVNTGQINNFIEQYKDDTRAGVIKLIERCLKQQKNIEDEIIRLDMMKAYENRYKEYTYICGIDEVGRGPLAGPVMTAAVVLPKDCKIMYINDSKKLSEQMRESLYDEILENAVDFAIGSISPDKIDEMNILQATYSAMHQSINNLKNKPDLVLVDAETIPNLDIKQIAIIKGDSKSMSIAASSILAKVTRDRLMVAYDKLFPQYNFASNKGYGSKEHIEAIKKYGPCPIHRKSFIKNFI